MRFMVLVKANKDSEAGVLPDEKILTAMGKFNVELEKAGVMLAGEGLQASSKGARVRFSGSKRTVLDGPFAEMKELIAGFWLWEVKWRFARCSSRTTSVMRSSRSSRSKRSDCARRPRRGDRTMRFMIVVKATKDSEAGVMPHEKILNEMAKYHEELQKAGVLLDASGLQATSKGWRVKYSGQKRSVVDGPFTESKELIAGYTIIQVKSKEEAMEWARRFPNPALNGQEGEIEVRQLFELDDFGPSEAVERFRKMDVG